MRPSWQSFLNRAFLYIVKYAYMEWNADARVSAVGSLGGWTVGAKLNWPKIDMTS